MVIPLLNLRVNFYCMEIIVGNSSLELNLKYFLEVINFSVYIYGKFRPFYVSGEETVGKDARMSLLRLFEHI